MSEELYNQNEICQTLGSKTPKCDLALEIGRLLEDFERAVERLNIPIFIDYAGNKKVKIIIDFSHFWEHEK